MSDLALSRAFVSDIEIRSDGDGRTVHGIIVPFGVTARVSDGGRPYDEMFERGAFARTIQHQGSRVKLLSQHDSRRNPLGRATLLREDAAGLYGEFRVSATAAGDEALELLRDGALDSFSVGFRPIKHETRNRVLVRTEVGMREASLVTFPAYESALVGGVRMDDTVELDAITEHVIRAIELRATTPVGDSEHLGTATDAPARDELDPPEGTPFDVHKSFRHSRLLAREKGVLK